MHIRHSLAHLLAAAVMKKFPDAQLGIGPVIEDGFYYDFKLPRALAPEDLVELEASMRELAKANHAFTKKIVAPAAAKKMLKGQPFKQELAAELTKDKKQISFYETDDIFTDLCAGPHVAETAEIDPDGFKLTKIAGAYWRGDSTRDQLQRIYGIAFGSKAELEDYLKRLLEAQKRDHRVLGEKMGIFMFSEHVGSGFPLWLPNGEIIKHALMEYMREKEEKYGYRYVSTPVLTYGALYERSGHKQFYGDNMYRLTDPEGNELFVKPMNCPHTHMIYEKLTQSYRDLPLRLAEAGGIYRFELSGTLTGLIRVRGSITQNDSHIYVTPAQLAGEFKQVLALFAEVYAELGITDYRFQLSLPDFSSKKQKFGGDKKQWEWAAEEISAVMKASGLPYTEAIGEAAFYGPKLDVQMKNVMGKEDTIATAQVDILVPPRMGLTYIDEAGQKQHPIVIHRAILGSYERFIAFLLEQTAGYLPLWLAPVQAVILPIGADQEAYAATVLASLKSAGVRAELSANNLTLGKRIRAAEIARTPYILVLGNKEMAAQTVSVRHGKRGDLGVMPVPELVKKLATSIHARSLE